MAQMDAMIAVSQSFSSWTLARTTFNRAASTYGVGVYSCHRVKDGYVVFSLSPGRITDWFRELVGRDELTPEAIAGWIAERTVDEVVKLLVEVGIPVAPVHDLDDVLANEHARAREMFVQVKYPVLGEITEPGYSITFSETKGDLKTPAPLLGEHNEEVLTKLLGYSKEEVEGLRKDGNIWHAADEGLVGG